MYHDTLETSIRSDLLNLRLVLPCVWDERDQRQADDYNGASEPHFENCLPARPLGVVV